MTRPTAAPSPSRDRKRLGPRWWLIAAIAFAGINVVLSPITMILFWGMMVAVGFGGAPLPQQWLAAVVGIVIIPGLFASGLATALEAGLRRLNRPDRTKFWSWRSLVIFVVLVSPCAFLPIAFVLALDGLGGTDEELEAAQLRARRPIAESDSMGFCSVPTWTIRDERLELTIAVRVPETASYALVSRGTFGGKHSDNGRARVSRTLSGRAVRELEPGVDTMTVRLGEADTRPMEWPVRITNISLSRTDGTGDIDFRWGDSLYVIDQTSASSP